MNAIFKVILVIGLTIYSLNTSGQQVLLNHIYEDIGLTLSQIKFGSGNTFTICHFTTQAKENGLFWYSTSNDTLFLLYPDNVVERYRLYDSIHFKLLSEPNQLITIDSSYSFNLSPNVHFYLSKTPFNGTYKTAIERNLKDTVSTIYYVNRKNKIYLIETYRKNTLISSKKYCYYPPKRIPIYLLRDNCQLWGEIK